MSIIHDALKKSGQPVIGENDRSKQPIRPELERHRRRASVNWGPLFVVAVLLLVAGPVLGPLFFHSARRPDAPRSVSMGREVSTNLGQFAVEEAPAPARNLFQGLSRGKSPASSPFTLIGVVYSGLHGGRDSYCLI